MNSKSILEGIILSLPEISKSHRRSSETYQLYDIILKEEVKKLFSDDSIQPKSFLPFGELIFPYFKMGAIDSLDLFGLDELIIFSYYWKNKDKYKNVADIGANIGLHSIILSKCGFNVRSFEPDPIHYDKIQNNLMLNKCAGVEVFQKAISKVAGTAEFVRVKGNTTGSHLAGSKSNTYGELDKFTVDIEPFRPVIQWADLVKLDAEGHEKEILLSTEASDWENTDVMVEIGSIENATAIFEHCKKFEVNIFIQKHNWEKATTASELPISHREGSAFLSKKNIMPW
ncbi:MAG: FkbM family methyltransferase [Leptospira sp.]|nr:FkbM family methyltransferase [Leptospira sp.]